MPRLHPRTTRSRGIGVAVALAMGGLIPGVAAAPAQAAPAPGRASGSAPAAASGATVSFTFDDGRTSQHLNAVPLLDAAGMKGTFFIISDALTWGPSYLTADQVRALAAGGHEIGNHTKTHSDLSELSASKVREEFQKSQAKIISVAGRAPVSCAYPYGAADSTVESVAAEFFRGCRSTDGGTNQRTTDRYRLRTYYVHSSTTAAQIRAAVDRAVADKAWLILCYHGIGKVNSSDDVSRDTFATHVQAVKASGVTVRTVAQALG